MSKLVGENMSGPYEEKRCPSCDLLLDEKGRCRACYGDVFGICSECDEILNSDHRCPNGCLPIENEEEKEPHTHPGIVVDFGALRTVEIVAKSWPGGGRAIGFGRALEKALGVSLGKMTLVEMEPHRKFRVVTSVSEERFRVALKSSGYSDHEPNVSFQIVD